MANALDIIADQLRPDLARRVELAVTIDGKDATSYMDRRVLSFEYVDNAEGKGDEVSIELQDRDSQWLNYWLPEKGCVITARVTCHDWPTPRKTAVLNCGQFTCDTPAEYSGPPGKVSIKAITASLTGELRDTQRTKAWEHYSLEMVAGEIAAKNGLVLYYEAPAHDFERQDQRCESDLAFLTRLAEDCGVSVKVYDGRLVLFDGEGADAKGAAIHINRRGGNYLTAKEYSFSVSSDGTGYDSAEVQYHDPKTKKTHKVKVKVKPGIPGGNRDRLSKVLKSNERCESEAGARRKAKSKLRKANKQELRGELTLMGNPGLVAGMTVQLDDFGKFSGKYFVEKATHKISGGYDTTIEVRPTLAGY